MLLITADHGNAEQMWTEKNGKRSTHVAHALNPVHFIIKDFSGANTWDLLPAEIRDCAMWQPASAPCWNAKLHRITTSLSSPLRNDRIDNPNPKGYPSLIYSIPEGYMRFKQLSAASSMILTIFLNTPMVLSQSLCSDPSYIYCNDFESGVGPCNSFGIAKSCGLRCQGAGKDSSCAYSELIHENEALPPYPAIRFPSQNKTLFVRYELKNPSNFFIGRGSHGYYLYDSTNRNNGSVVIDPQSEGRLLHYLEWDDYTTTLLRGSGYQRMSTSFQGFEPRQRGQWHSYQLMVVPSNKDPNIGRLKLWIDGELAVYTKTDTIPQYDTFWISNYWHSLIYIAQDNPCCGNLHESHTAPLHPPFELLLDNVVVAPEYIEKGNDAFKIERTKFWNFTTPGAFKVNFDTTLQAKGKIEWGETSSYGRVTEEASSGYFHTMEVSGLAPRKTYYFRITAADKNNRTTSWSSTFQTPADNLVPDFNLPDWKGEVYQNLNSTGAPVFIQNFKSLSYISWAGQDSDDLVRTDQHMSVRYTRSIPLAAGTYSFKVGAYDGIQVAIDGVSKVNLTSRTNGHNARHDFNQALSAGMHSIMVNHIIYRYNDWENTSQKHLSFAVEPQDMTAPKILSHGIYSSEFYLSTAPYFTARCDEDCTVAIDYGLTTAYGQQITAGGNTSPIPSVRFPELPLGAVYHYRLTVSDAMGNRRTIPEDYTFRVGDSIPPRQIVNLQLSRINPSTLRLTFRAPGEDGKMGTASSYDLRTLNFPLNLQNWEQAAKVALPAPKAGGTTETLDLSGFPAGQTYYFALRALDNAGQPGLISNVVSDPASPEVLDLDGDGYGAGSALGPDCDDQDPSKHSPSPSYASGYCTTGTLPLTLTSGQSQTSPAKPRNLRAQ